MASNWRRTSRWWRRSASRIWSWPVTIRGLDRPRPLPPSLPSSSWWTRLGSSVSVWNLNFGGLFYLRNNVKCIKVGLPTSSNFRSFKKWAFLGLFLFSSFQYSVWSIILPYKNYQWLESNRRSLVLEATALPTVPQKLSNNLHSFLKWANPGLFLFYFRCFHITYI